MLYLSLYNTDNYLCVCLWQSNKDVSTMEDVSTTEDPNLSLVFGMKENVGALAQALRIFEVSIYSYYSYSLLEIKCRICRFIKPKIRQHGVLYIFSKLSNIGVRKM